MKQFLLAILAAMTVAAGPATNEPVQVKLAWDASPTTNVTYVLTASNHLVLEKFNVSTNLTCRLSHMEAGQWTFWVQAAQSNVLSLPSNILVLEVPTSPAGFRTVVVQETLNFTNWTDRGFFRLYIP